VVWRQLTHGSQTGSYAQAAQLGARVFAVLMIVLNGVVGLALFLGGLRHREQAYNLQGAVAYLSVIALILPKFKISRPNDALTKTQSIKNLETLPASKLVEVDHFISGLNPNRRNEHISALKATAGSQNAKFWRNKRQHPRCPLSVESPRETEA
jgi:hypothetical protein